MIKKAIILLNNNQYLLYNKKITYINKIKNIKNKSKLYIDKILLVYYNNNVVKIGNPFLKNYLIKILILNNIKNKKKIIFKKKKRKGYTKKKGHREILTKIKILYIKKKYGT
ncbi:MAG: 50S ribosomal protein L21 [Candidatus Shikimatogenerans bostrichidophilus]|nr:MAG: 50S ribosomal protein L21 [Candidatus Shikimatogenerans bostrichidophilus]